MVFHLADAEEFAAQRAALDFEVHGLGKVTARHGADHAGHFGGRLHQVRDQAVNRFDVRCPRSGRIGQLGAMADLAFLAHHIAQARQLPGHLFVQLDHIVEGLTDFAIDAGQSDRQPHRKIAFAESPESGKEIVAVEGGGGGACGSGGAEDRGGDGFGRCCCCFTHFLAP